MEDKKGGGKNPQLYHEEPQKTNKATKFSKAKGQEQEESGKGRAYITGKKREKRGRKRINLNS